MLGKKDIWEYNKSHLPNRLVESVDIFVQHEGQKTTSTCLFLKGACGYLFLSEKILILDN
jgi:hypothetical protein